MDGLGGYPDADLAITAPGEESGTYDSFVDIALGDIAEARFEDGDITEEQVGTTRPDYQDSPNDNVIIDGLAGSAASLGWVGYAFYAENQDVVGAYEIDGGDGCVAPPRRPSPTPPTRSPGACTSTSTRRRRTKPALPAFVDFYVARA